MKMIHSATQNTYNFIPDNGVQTSIKTNPSGSFDSNHLDRDKPILVDKNKYTVIISSSLGCQMSCGFCHLTKTNKPFSNITADDIFINVMEAIEAVFTQDSSISNKMIKLCYMGEGEALLDMAKTSDSAKLIISEVIDKGFASGLDGIDIATCMPKIGNKVFDEVIALNNYFSDSYYKLNPYNHDQPNRSVVRLFYSLHHYDQTKRDIIIPNSKSIDVAIDKLTWLNSQGVNVVTHYMFMSGVNDSMQDVTSLVDFINTRELFQSSEFRILRYNGFGEDVESSILKGIIKYLEDELIVGKFKVQFSAGEDIKAACGMFV